MPTRARRKPSPAEKPKAKKTWDEVKDDVRRSNDRITKGVKQDQGENKWMSKAGKDSSQVVSEEPHVLQRHARKETKGRKEAKGPKKVLKKTETGYQGTGPISTYSDYD
jgi:hypothetical protein